MKKIICIVLALVLVAAPLSSLATANAALETEDILVDTIIEIILQTLHGWGIDIVSEVPEYIKNFTLQNLIEYVEQELDQTFNTFVMNWTYYYDALGRLHLTDGIVDALNLFVIWLVQKYNLRDGINVTVGGSYQIGGVTCYALPLSMFIGNSQTGFNNWVNVYSSGEPVYVAFHIQSGSGYLFPYFFSRGAFGVTQKKYKGDGTLSSETTFNINALLSNSTWYAGGGSAPQMGGYQLANPGIVYYSSVNDIKSALQNNTVVTWDEPVTIVPSDMQYPELDPPGYQDGYSMIFFPDGTVGYMDIDWPQSISVDNLPAVISPAGTQDPGFAGAWAPVRYFVNTFSESIGIMRTIIYGLPEQVMVIFYFILSVTVVFGAIHLFKEH